MLGLLLYSFQVESERRRAAVLESVTQTAQVVAALVDSTFDETLALAALVAGEVERRGLNPEEPRPYLERVAASYPAVSAVAVADATGNLVVTTAPLSPETPRPTVADRPYFQRVMATNAPTLSSVQIGRVTGAVTVTAAAPVSGPEGQPIGAVLVGLELSRLTDWLEQVGLAPGQAIFLVGPDGELGFHSAVQNLSSGEQPGDFSDVAEVRAALAGQAVRTASYLSPITGDRRVAVVIPSPAYGWAIGVTWPVEAAFGPSDAAQRRELLAFLLVAALAVAAALLLARQVTKPLAALAAAARSLGAGDLGQRVAIQTGDELETVGDAFNRMADELAFARDRRQRFIAAVAHDLGQPITIIRGQAQLLSRRGDDPARRGSGLAAIQAAATTLERLRLDLLDVTQLTAGRFKVRPEPMELMGLLRSLVEARRETAPGHRLVIEGPPEVHGHWDRDRLAQVVSNLLGNAIKYSPEGGEVRIEVSQQNGMVRVCITDRGLGLRPDSVSRLFVPFERLDEARSLAGLGLGLYISKGVVEAHGGRIWAESPGPGQGSTFCFTLPQQPAQDLSR